jgi:hypothetical protein
LEVLRGQIAGLSAELAEVEEELRDLRITRATVERVLAGSTVPAPRAAPDAAAALAAAEASAVEVVVAPRFQAVLAAFAAQTPLRCKDVCRALGQEMIPARVESMRGRLKKLCGRGLLVEPEPGLFVLAGGAR